jgi:ankyrin repeat protein
VFKRGISFNNIAMSKSKESMEPILKVCLGCGHCSEKMDKCKICKDELKVKSYYCSKACQSRDWTRHKAFHKEKARSISAGTESSSVGDDADENGMTPLMKACFEGDWRGAETLLKAGADATVVDHQGLSAMNYAISGRKLKVVEVLCKLAPPSLIAQGTSSWRNSTCLMQACYIGNLEMLKVLTLTGGNELLAAADADGRTCLHMACKFGHLDLVRFLLKTGGQPLLLHKDLDGHTCLAGVIENDRADVCKLLLEAGGEALLSSKNISGNSPVSDACLLGSTKVLRAMASAVGPRLVDILMTDNCSSLMTACNKGHVSAVETVAALPGSAPLFLRPGEDGCACVHAAVNSGNPAVLRAVLRAGGADQIFLASPAWLCTPLHVACGADRAETASALLAAAGDPAGRERLLYAADKNGDTPAHTAAM